jgi:hypothetical protein
MEIGNIEHVSTNSCSGTIDMCAEVELLDGVFADVLFEYDPPVSGTRTTPPTGASVDIMSIKLEDRNFDYRNSVDDSIEVEIEEAIMDKMDEMGRL